MCAEVDIPKAFHLLLIVRGCRGLPTAGWTTRFWCGCWLAGDADKIAPQVFGLVQGLIRCAEEGVMRGRVKWCGRKPAAERDSKVLFRDRRSLGA